MPDKNIHRGTAKTAEPRVVGTCATCGRPLTQHGSHAECLRCLFNWGFVAEDEQSAHSVGKRLSPGPLSYAHFEVEVGADGFPVELGAGAMAVTYRARDTVLNSTVALKVIDRSVAENPGARSRFLREARAAAQIHHPNVARVSHYGEQDGECFYVMELVEGETLEARVRRDGAISLALALEVIEQTAHALMAAEACGVVHRDIKPSNIMIESDPSGTPIVKLIDYGIAKVLASEAEFGAEQTQTTFVGTPAFASPEQFAPAGQTRIDTRSDIYSLGVTFWYVLCGRVPFVGRSFEDIRARQTQPLPLEQLKGLHIPARCLGLLKSMLAPDPKDRPQSGRELLAQVHRCYTKFGSEAQERRRRSALVAGGVVLVLTVIGLGTWLYQRAQSSAQMERSIAVLPFENLSPNGEDTYFTVGMQDEITSDLARLAGMKVIGAQSTRSYPPAKPRNLRTIARELGVRHLLEGAVSRESGVMRVSLKLVDTRDTDHPWTEGYERSAKDVFALQSEITRAIAARLQTRVSSKETAALDLPPTADLRAYDLYLQARAIPPVMSEDSPSESLRKGKRGIQLLDEAITRDPNFVLAYCELAKWHDELYYDRGMFSPEEQLVDHRTLAETALEKARRLQPESGAVHLALAIHVLRINHNTEEAETQIQLARRALPNDAIVESIAGRVARRRDRWGDAVRFLERAISLEPRDPGLLGLLADTYEYMRRYADCDRVMASRIAVMPSGELGLLPLLRARSGIERSADLNPFRAAFAAQAAAGQLDDEQLRSSEMNLALWTHDPAAISKALSKKKHGDLYVDVEGGTAFPEAWFQALAARMRGDHAAAVAAFTAARVQAEKNVLSQPAYGPTLSLLALIDAGMGNAEKAVEEGKRACELASFKINNLDAPAVRCNLAVVYSWTGKNDLAFAELGNLMDRPAGDNVLHQPTYGDFRLNPLWDTLRSDPRFEALVQRLAPTASK